MDRKLFVTLSAFTGLLLTLYLLYLILNPFLLAIGWAAVIAIATFPIYRRLEARLGPGGVGAPGLMTLGVFLVIVVPTVVLVALLVQELLHLQGVIELKAGGQALAEKVLGDPRVAAWMDRAEALAAQANLRISRSRGSKPAMAPSISAASSAVSVIMPPWSRLEAKAIMP